MKSLLSLAALGFLLVGCAQHPVDEARSNASDVAESLCSCPDVVAGSGYASEEECIRETELTSTDSQIECLKAAYDRNESAASAPIECINRQSSEAASCARDAACNAVALERCADLLDGDACPELPESVEREFDACGG